MFKFIKSLFMGLIILLLVLIPIVTIIAVFFLIFDSLEKEVFTQDHYVSILGVILSSSIGLAGNILTVLGAYFVFIKQKQNVNDDKKEIDKFNLDSLSNVLIESILDSDTLVNDLCFHFSSKGVSGGVLSGLIFLILKYEHHLTDVNSEGIELLSKEIYQFNPYGLSIIKKEKNYSEIYSSDKFENIERYFSFEDRKYLRQWLIIMNTVEFNSLRDLYEYLDCREKIIFIINNHKELLKMNSFRKITSMDDLFKEIYKSRQSLMDLHQLS